MTGIDFLTQLNGRVTSKRQSQKEFAHIAGQSPTATQSEWVHGVNVTRFGELWKHDPKRLEKEIEKRIAWQIANDEQRAEIMSAIRMVG
jgi:hypothetical protein